MRDKLLTVVIISVLASCQPSSIPFFPKTEVCITDYGARGDGEYLNTAAFEKAVEDLSSRGGGHLVVPAGIWLTGPIELRGNIDLHLERNAVISFSPDTSLYKVVDINFEGKDTKRCQPQISCRNQRNVAITGYGIIDGNGDSWRELDPDKVPPRVFRRMAGRPGVIDGTTGKWYPDEGYIIGRKASGNLNIPDFELSGQTVAQIKTFLRPVMVSFCGCEDVLIEGCTFVNSPCWNIHPLWCRNLTVRDIKVISPDFSANGDGIDIDGCENVLLVNSTFDVGDDGICIKSGKDEDGRRHSRPSRNIVIDGCTVLRAHGGFTVGSEMSGGVEDIRVSNCSFIGTEVGLRFKTRRGRGGYVRDIRMDHIYMKDIIDNAIVVNMYYANTSASDARQLGLNCGEGTVCEADETTPVFERLSFSNITVAGCGRALFINGLPEMKARGLSFENCHFRAGKDSEINYVENIWFDNVTVNGVSFLPSSF